MQDKLDRLRAKLHEINDLESAAALLNWDQMTNMPPGGAAARARQSAALSRITHERAVDPEIGSLLEDLRSYESGLPYDSDEASLIRVARREYERAVKVPPDFKAEFNAHAAETYNVWTKARADDNFAEVRPLLEKTLDLSRALANFFPGYEHIADPLIEMEDYGMNVASIRKLFGGLRERLVPMVRSIVDQKGADDACLRQEFDRRDQLSFGLKVIDRFGFDFNRGRQDVSPHPFTTKFSLNDVRITTRFNEHDLGDALFSLMHESGHAMYEQGIDEKFEGTPLAEGASSGVHESQSRLWENLVGRSKGFWRYFYPELQRTFPGQLKSVPLDTFYRAINKVQPSLIRTDADEVTYNLHVMIRFDLELSMLEGKLAVPDLPDAWRERYKQDLGISPPGDRQGVLQDVHWFAGVIGGAFQGYTLGNIISAQFFRAAVTARPEITGEIERGGFKPLHQWLTENIYRRGKKFTLAELVKKVCGGPVSIDPYLDYLRQKYGELYALEDKALAR